ncbi:membrane protein [Nitratireductor aestuarii]|uniref:Membrane protein n=1 Tax=Nitratireductor aestuarii TaxID=1735103 RepID=A0A916W8E2_9HYPH|nr:tripartite tricarboxylate transporter TctB family protein [Nitratireductor aestuarii]GGA76777.1 membrane protein [Nitratireductor aestuarii]
MLKNPKEGAAGLFFAAVGLLYGLMAWSSLDIGTALNMGPGYFPIVLSAIIFVFGAMMMGRSLVTPGETPIGKVPWRPLLLIMGAPVVFATVAEEIGMFPAVFVTTAVAAFAYPGATVPRILAISFGLSVFCTLVFAYAGRVPIPVIGPAFGEW